MRKIRLRFVALATTVAAIPVILLHCGGNGTTQSVPGAVDGAASDAGSPESSATDATSLDGGDEGDGGAADASGSVDAATPEAETPETSAGDGPSGDEGDGGTAVDSGNALDAAKDAAIDATPCDVDAADGASSCTGTMSCCGGWCTDTSHDWRNCGSCGNACASTQFCTGVACQDAVLKNICANPAATVVFDPYTDDNDAGLRMGNALATQCVPPVTVAYVNGDAGVGQDPDSGRPSTGPGNTLVVGGGSYGQPSVGYIDDTGLSTVRLQADGTDTWFQNFKTQTTIVRAANTTLTAHHDFFLLELNVDPASGTLCFAGIGFYNLGTLAAGYFFQNKVMPSLSTFTAAWYVYEWTDTDGDSAPSVGDAFRRVDQGL
jgi:hypothetical protein